MNMSHKWTFSLASIFLLLAFAAVPAMAQVTIKAEWKADLDDDPSTTATAQGAGWDIDFAGLEENDTVAVNFLDPAGPSAAGSNGVSTIPAAVAAGTSTGTIDVAEGAVIAVQVAVTTGTVTVTYQRVTFPAAGDDAELAKTTLLRLPKLKKLTTPNYYVNFANNETTVEFDFEAVKAGTNDAPSAPLHITDVSLSDNTDWIIHSVSGTNRVTLRSTKARNVASARTIVSLGNLYAQAATPADPVNIPGNGTARVYYDDTAPTAAIPTEDPVTAVAAPRCFSNTRHR